MHSYLHGSQMRTHTLSPTLTALVQTTPTPEHPIGTGNSPTGLPPTLPPVLTHTRALTLRPESRSSHCSPRQQARTAESCGWRQWSSRPATNSHRASPVFIQSNTSLHTLGSVPPLPQQGSSCQSSNQRGGLLSVMCAREGDPSSGPQSPP